MDLTSTRLISQCTYVDDNAHIRVWNTPRSPLTCPIPSLTHSLWILVGNKLTQTNVLGESPSQDQQVDLLMHTIERTAILNKAKGGSCQLHHEMCGLRESTLWNFSMRSNCIWLEIVGFPLEWVFVVLVCQERHNCCAQRMWLLLSLIGGRFSLHQWI